MDNISEDLFFKGRVYKYTRPTDRMTIPVANSGMIQGCQVLKISRREILLYRSLFFYFSLYSREVTRKHLLRTRRHVEKKMFTLIIVAYSLQK